MILLQVGMNRGCRLSKGEGMCKKLDCLNVFRKV